MTNKKDLARRATKGTLYVVFGSYTVTGITFLSNIILARILAPEDFGIWALALFYATAFAVLRDCGAESAVLYRKDNIKTVASTLFIVQVGLSLIGVALALVTSALFHASEYQQLGTLIILLAVSVVIETAGLIPRTLVEKQIEFRAVSFLEAAAVVIGFGLAVLAALNGWGVWSLAVQRVSLLIIKTIGFWLISKFEFTWTFDREIVRWFVKKFGVPVFLSSLASLFLFQFDNFLVGTIAGAVALGYYTRAYSLATLPTQLITHVISRVALPVYSQCQDDSAKLAKAFSVFLKFIWRLALPLAVILFLLAPQLIAFLIGDKWIAATPLLQLLAGYSLSRILLDDTGALFWGGLGQPKVTMVIFGIQAVLLIILGYLATQMWGASGAAIAVNVVMLIGVILAYAKIKRELPVNLTEILVAPLLAAAGTVTVYLFGHAYLPALSLFWYLVIHGALIVGVYAILLTVLEGKRLQQEVQEFFAYSKKS